MLVRMSLLAHVGVFLFFVVYGHFLGISFAINGIKVEIANSYL